MDRRRAAKSAVRGGHRRGNHRRLPPRATSTFCNTSERSEMIAPNDQLVRASTGDLSSCAWTKRTGGEHAPRGAPPSKEEGPTARSCHSPQGLTRPNPKDCDAWSCCQSTGRHELTQSPRVQTAVSTKCQLYACEPPNRVRVTPFSTERAVPLIVRLRPRHHLVCASYHNDEKNRPPLRQRRPPARSLTQRWKAKHPGHLTPPSHVQDGPAITRM